MPELPEVETVRKQLDKVLTGQRFRKIKVLNKKSLQGETLKIIGKKILGVKRKAKMIWIDLEGENKLLIHLKMTGQLLINGEVGKHTRVIIQLSKNKVIFNDLRLFGWIKVVNSKKLEQHLAKLPPDAVDKEFTVKYLEKVLKGSKRAIKLILLDQSKIGGLGNIYVNEALFCAGINPTRKFSDYGKRLRRLHACIKKILRLGIKYGGTTASDEKFLDIFGKPGKAQKHLKVYENNGRCYQCKSEIKKIKLGGRGTYYCPQCQK